MHFRFFVPGDVGFVGLHFGGAAEGPAAAEVGVAFCVDVGDAEVLEHGKAVCCMRLVVLIAGWNVR